MNLKVMPLVMGTREQYAMMSGMLFCFLAQTKTKTKSKIKYAMMLNIWSREWKLKNVTKFWTLYCSRVLILKLKGEVV